MRVSHGALERIAGRRGSGLAARTQTGQIYRREGCLDRATRPRRQAEGRLPKQRARSPRDGREDLDLDEVKVARASVADGVLRARLTVVADALDHLGAGLLSR